MQNTFKMNAMANRRATAWARYGLQLIALSLPINLAMIGTAAGWPDVALAHLMGRQQNEVAQERKSHVTSQSIEETTRVHRLNTTKRSPFDAFAYLNRIPTKADEGETAEDLAGRIFGRLANQEGRVLLKLPPGMNRESYRGFKTFLRYEGKASVGNCAACHALADFTDMKKHVVTQRGEAKRTSSLRNLKKESAELRKILMEKMDASRRIRAGKATMIDDAYGTMEFGKDDIPGLLAFLGLLQDVSDKEFRRLILDARVLDTSEEQ